MSRKARKKNCNRYRKQKFKGDNYLRVIEGGALLRKRQKEVNIIPRNFNQDNLLGYSEDHNINIVFAIGPAGTGKTFLAVAVGLTMLLEKKIERIILSRPAVEAGERLGFLPGDMREKVDPYFCLLYTSDAADE